MKIFSLVLILLISGCSVSRYGENRSFTTSFESFSDFEGFYIVPTNDKGTSSHELSTNEVHSGTYSHKGWIYGTNEQGSALNNQNHRGYPTIQFQKTAGGVYITPCLVTLWVWLDMPLTNRSTINDWFSFATFSPDSSDTWSRTMLINLNPDGFVRLMHLPNQGQSQLYYQNTSLKFPQREWVKLTAYLDFDSLNGYAKVWMNDELVSYGPIKGGNSILAQAHFGLYAAPAISNGVIYNDDLEIREVNAEP